ncbi:hypothetical protein C5S39_09845 [Candidatus Methanophagaceae archaeon]|jgi:hypothetical protein|nr:hypothetical protein C5S39_09845 [Methanophagales archaeon]
MGKSLKNDIIAAVGVPKVGYEVIDAINANARDIIIIGGYQIKMERGIEERLKVDIEKSAGPSTVILLTMEEENIEQVKRIIKKPFRVWGE